MPVGKANYDTKNKARTNFWALTPEVTELIVKILPPFGSLAESGKWFQWAAIHWSMPDSNGRKHTFYCVEERKNRQVVVACPMCVRHVEADSEWDAKRQAGIADQDIKVLRDIAFSTGAVKGYHFNVMNLEGKCGVLRLAKKAKDLLDKEIEDLRKDTRSPRDPIQDGVFFKISRMGNKLDVVYTVRAHEDYVTYGDRIVKDVKCDPFTDAQARMMDSPEFSGRDLSNLAVKLDITQVAYLASGDTTTVDRIFGASKKSTTTNTTAATATQPAPVNAPSPPLTQQTALVSAASPSPAAVVPLPASNSVSGLPPSPPVPSTASGTTAGVMASQASLPSPERVPAVTPAPSPVGPRQMTEAELMEAFKTDGLEP